MLFITDKDTAQERTHNAFDLGKFEDKAAKEHDTMNALLGKREESRLILLSSPSPIIMTIDTQSFNAMSLGSGVL